MSQLLPGHHLGSQPSDDCCLQTYHVLVYREQLSSVATYSSYHHSIVGSNRRTQQRHHRRGNRQAALRCLSRQDLNQIFYHTHYFQGLSSSATILMTYQTRSSFGTCPTEHHCHQSTVQSSERKPGEFFHVFN